MSTSEATVLTSTDREIVVTRTFAAGPELVWRTWTDPASIGRWWGPLGFDTTTHSMALEPGGEWRFDMHGPDGRSYPNRVIYEEVEPARRLVYRHTGDDDVEPVSFRVTVTFEEAGGGTRLTMRMDFGSAAQREHVNRHGAVDGAYQTVGRLADELDERSARGSLTITLPSEREILMAREFEAPRELVWKAITTPELVKKWLLGPPGWEMVVCRIDLRAGGSFRYGWRKDDGTEMGMGGEYQAIEPPERLENTEKFDDAWYEGDALVTQRLVEHAGGRRTTLTLSVRYDSRAIRDGVLASPMKDGVTICYDLLADLLKTM
jgi:uncharacterized protein YndB with AHSA1/START domain